MHLNRIPVLHLCCGRSRMAAPVVSLPVPKISILQKWYSKAESTSGFRYDTQLPPTNFAIFIITSFTDVGYVQPQKPALIIFWGACSKVKRKGSEISDFFEDFILSTRSSRHSNQRQHRILRNFRFSEWRSDEIHKIRLRVWGVEGGRLKFKIS